MKWEPPKRLPKDYCKLEQQLEAELNLPWQVVLGRDCAETRVGYGRIRVAELHVIEGVEGLGAELHAESFYSVEFLEEREVCAGETWATQVVIIGRPVAKMIGLRLAEVHLIEVGIQPLMNIAVQRSILAIGVGIERLHIEAGEVIASTDLQRIAALQRGDAVDLPSSEGCILDAVEMAAELTTTSKGKIVDVTDDEALPYVIGGNSIIFHRVETILVIRTVVVVLAPHIGTLKLQALREALADAYLQRVILVVATGDE